MDILGTCAFLSVLISVMHCFSLHVGGFHSGKTKATKVMIWVLFLGDNTLPDCCKIRLRFSVTSNHNREISS